MDQHLGTIIAVSVIVGGVVVFLVIRALMGRGQDRLPFHKDTRNLEEEERDFYTGRHYRGRLSQLDILGHIRERLKVLAEPETDERRRYVIDTRLQNVEMLLEFVCRKYDATPTAVDDEAAADIDASHPLVTDLERQPTRYGEGEVVMVRNSLKAKLHTWIADRQGPGDRA